MIFLQPLICQKDVRYVRKVITFSLLCDFLINIKELNLLVFNIWDILIGWQSVSKSNEVVKMMPEPISCSIGLFQSAGKASSKQKWMAVSKIGSWVIIKIWLHFKAWERVKWSSCMIPYVSNYVIYFSMPEQVNRARRKPMKSVIVSLNEWKLIDIGNILIPCCKKFLLSWESIIFSLFDAFPFAKCFSF